MARVYTSKSTLDRSSDIVWLEFEGRPQEKTMTIMENEGVSFDTGLCDRYGSPIYILDCPDQIGFVRKT